MIETTIEQVRKNSIAWDGEGDRNAKLFKFQYSVVLESSFLEMDTANEWLENRVGQPEVAWDFYFYYKESYDYGYVEYFFKDEKSHEIFKAEIPNFYGIWPVGGRFRTRGWDVFLEE